MLDALFFFQMNEKRDRNQLGVAQRNIINKIAELDLERSEHNIVLEELLKLNRSTNNEVNIVESHPNQRTCYRLVNNILMKKGVTDVITDLKDSIASMEALTKALDERLQKVSQELGAE